MTRGAAPGMVPTPGHSRGAQTDTTGHWEQEGGGSSECEVQAPSERPGRPRLASSEGLTFQMKWQCFQLNPTLHIR